MCARAHQRFHIRTTPFRLDPALHLACARTHRYTHKIEARGAFWPDGSALFCLVLATAQLLLACVHASKQSWVTFCCTLPLVLITWKVLPTYGSRIALGGPTVP